VDSPSNATRKSSLLLPALLVGSVLSGSTLGIFLTNQLSPTTQPKHETIIQPLNTASVGASNGASYEVSFEASNEVSNEAPIEPPLELSVQPESFTSMALVADPALQYLIASASLSPYSKQLTGSINHVKFERPEWTWSRTELYTNYAPMNRLFGTHNEEPILVAAETPVIPTAQPKPLETATLATPEATTVKPENPVAALEAKTATAEATTDKSNDRLVVALDPGHGGTDPGSEAHNGLVEKELTLDMAKRVELFLSEIENVDVIMTRNSDTGMSRQGRVDKIRAADADVVVSLHFNHLPQTDVNLVESFYADRQNVAESLRAQNRSPSSVNLDYTDASKNLAGILHRKVFNEVASVNENVVDAGVKNETLYVLTRSFTPGALLELTCISNPAEAERLSTVEYRNQLAASIADGLRDYLMNEHSDQFAQILAEHDSSKKIDQKL